MSAKKREQESKDLMHWALVKISSRMKMGAGSAEAVDKAIREMVDAENYCSSHTQVVSLLTLVRLTLDP